MKALGLIFKILAATVLLVIIGVGVIIATVDPNDYRDEITQAVKDNTGRDFTVENMSLSVFPQLAINLEQASLSNAKGFSEQAFVEVEKVQVGAAIMPLLSRQLEVETLTLHGLNLNLEKDTDGKTNWADLSKTEADKTETDDSRGKGMQGLDSLNFGGIDIRNGQIHWHDKQSQQNVSLTNLNLTTGAVTFGEFFDVNLNADSKVNKPEIAAQLQLELQAKIEQSGQFELKNLVVNNEISGAGIPVANLKTTTRLPQLTLAPQTIALDSVLIEYDMVGGENFPLDKTTGKLDIKQLSGNLENQTFEAGSIVLQSEISGDSIPSGTTSLELKTSTKLDLTKQTASIPEFELKAMDMLVKGSASAKQIIDNPAASAKINVGETNLRKLLEAIKVTLPEMADTNTLTKFSSSLELAFSSKPQALKIDNLNLNLDQSKLNGSASVKNFESPAIAYNLTLDKIDLNQYLPPKKPGTEQTETKTEEVKIELPTELMRKLNINGTVKVGQLAVDKLKPTNIIVKTTAAKGNININPIAADIFKTRVNAQANINVKGETPKYSFKTNTQKLPIGEVLITFTGNDRISGTGNLNADINTAGQTITEFKQNLNGRINADLKDGAVKGFNLAQIIRDAKAKIAGKKSEATKEEPKTDFSELIAQLTIKQGIVNTDKLTAKAPFMRINGSGTVDLPKEKLKYLVKTKIVDSDKGQGGQELKELNGLTIPVKLRGKYTDPDISLDLNSLLEQKAKDKVKKKIDKKKKEVEQKLKDSLFKGLKF